MALRNLCALGRYAMVIIYGLTFAHALGNTNHVENNQATPDHSPPLAYWLDGTFSNKKIHILQIELRDPNIAIRASSAHERGLTPSDFAEKTQAIAVINGDFFDAAKKTIGLAIGQGEVWPGSLDTKGWSFLACNQANDCLIESSNTVSNPRPDWNSVVGGWQVLLEPNFEWSESLDTKCGPFCTSEHPRTAIGLSADKKIMWWIMIEGRQGQLTGLSLSKTTLLFRKLGAAWALNLDGGGSSGLILNGRRVNGRPLNEPQERSVANCLAVVRRNPSAR